MKAIGKLVPSMDARKHPISATGRHDMRHDNSLPTRIRYQAIYARLNNATSRKLATARIFTISRSAWTEVKKYLEEDAARVRKLIGEDERMLRLV